MVTTLTGSTSSATSPGYLVLATSLFLYPLFGLISMTAYMLKTIVKILARLSQGELLSSMLNPKDAIFIATEMSLESMYAKPIQVLPIVLILGGEFKLEKFKEQIQSTIFKRGGGGPGCVNYERLRQFPTQWFGYTFFTWEHDFALDQHIRVLDKCSLPAGNQQTIEGFVAEHIQDAFQPNTSPWEIIVARNYGNCSTKTLMMIRAHHSLCDGYSILKLLSAMIGQEIEVGAGITISPRDISSSKRPGAGASFDAYANARAIFGQKGWVEKIIRLPLRFVQTMGSTDTCGLGAKDAIGQNKILYTRVGPIPLENFKIIKRKLNVTFSAVMNAAISSALNARFGREIRGRKGGLSAMFNFPIHTPSTVNSISPLQNAFGTGVVQLAFPKPTATATAGANSTFIDLLKSSDNNWKTTLAHPEIMKTIDGVANILGSLPTSISRHLVSSGDGVIGISNIPGPTCPINFSASIKIIDLIYWVTTKCPLGISIFSYCGNVSIGICSHSNFIGSQVELNAFGECVVREIQNAFCNLMNND